MTATLSNLNNVFKIEQNSFTENFATLKFMNQLGYVLALTCR